MSAPRAKSRARPRKRATRRKPGVRARAAIRLRRRRLWRRILLSGVVVAAVVGAAVLIPLRIAHDPVVVCADDPGTFPEAGIEGWRGEQLENAATIMTTASALGLSRDGQILGVMTAMGESSLRNIDYGDWETSGFTNPDGTRTSSIGLFQQQDWWGSVEQRMDPATSATLFFTRLARLPDWQQMERSHAIHRVQINTDRDYYSRYEADAVAVVDGLSHGC
ncbi:hypothetical protein KZC51_15955 [Microbacterium sp. SSW1-49]|uniref:Peptidase M23 n=1 Tax=Microbacterium croceum TaxID=2851645 RepID=A0ABT0FI90_9MICO|nr:hypothetical protein [Microbacterium croceum]MCK2037624.1 hypothetical protein [Microbacterium croceum]